MVKTIEREMKVFRNGRSRAVRIPDEFGLDGDTLTLRKCGDGPVTIEQRRRIGILELVARWEPLLSNEGLQRIERADGTWRTDAKVEDDLNVTKRHLEDSGQSICSTRTSFRTSSTSRREPSFAHSRSGVSRISAPACSWPANSSTEPQSEAHRS